MGAVRFQKISKKYQGLPCSVCGGGVDENGGYIDGHPGTNFCSRCKQDYKAAQPKTVKKQDWRTAGREKGMTVNRALRDPKIQTVFASGGRAIVRRKGRN